MTRLFEPSNNKIHNIGRSWLVVVFALVSLGLVGVVLLGLISEPMQADGYLQDEETLLSNPIQLDLSMLELEFDLGEYWENAGFIIVDQQVETVEYKEQNQTDLIEWNQVVENWLFAPEEPGITLQEYVPELVAEIAKSQQVYFAQDSSGYTIGLLASIPGSNQQVMGRVWRFEMLNPIKYREHHLDNNHLLEGSPSLAGSSSRTTSSAPALAIVIDDWGYHSLAAEHLLQYPYPLTIAVLPYLTSSVRLAELGSERGHEVILHQPMEPIDRSLDPGLGVINHDMSNEAIVNQLMLNLRHLPMIVGMNNHMGSLATSNWRVMEQVLNVLKQTGLFFLDSNTTTTSVVTAVAEEVGVPYAVNDFFIDNVNDEFLIIEQIKQGIARAQRYGQAIVIGHVRSQTANALWRMIPDIVESGVQIVPVSSLLQVPENTSL